MAEILDKSATADDQVRRWQEEIGRAQRYFQSWEKRAEKIIKQFKREEKSGNRSFAMLWANTEVMKTVTYARSPVPQISRRYKDRDPVARTAAEMLERASTYEMDRTHAHDKFKHVRDDLLLPGRGTIWARYANTVEGSKVSNEKAELDYIHWKDFLHSPARYWEEVWWVAKRAYLTKDEGERRFGDKWKGVGLDHQADKSNTSLKDPTNGVEAKATVWEIWSLRDRKVYFMAKECDHILEVADPFVTFDDFFPCPPPVFSTLTTDTTVPSPDYYFYQDQAEEINDLTNRIAHLTDRLVLKGFYPSGKGDLTKAIETAYAAHTSELRNQVLIPIESWAVTGGEKGMKDMVLWLPIDQVAAALKSTIELRNQLISDVYQITGLSDIVRGATDPNETATAQQLKSQWGSIRVRDRQQAFADFTKRALGLVCEIISERFQPDHIIAIANMMPEQPAEPVAPPAPPMASQPGMPGAPSGAVPQPPMGTGPGMGGTPMGSPQPSPELLEYQQKVEQVQKAVQLLRSEDMRCYRIDIETDSTIAPDEDAEKQRRTEFMAAVGDFLQKSMPVIQAAPQLLPMAKEMMLFTVRGFRAGRMMEDVIEKALDSLEKAATAAAGQPHIEPKDELEKRKFDEVEKPMAAEDLKNKQLSNQMLEHQVQRAPLEAQMMDEEHRGKTEDRRAVQAQSVRDRAMQVREEARKDKQIEISENDQKAKTTQTEKENSFKERELGHRADEVALSGGKSKGGPMTDLIGKLVSGQAQLQQSMDMIAQLAAKPRKISIEHGANGRITGGESRIAN